MILLGVRWTLYNHFQQNHISVVRQKITHTSTVWILYYNGADNLHRAHNNTWSIPKCSSWAWTMIVGSVVALILWGQEWAQAPSPGACLYTSRRWVTYGWGHFHSSAFSSFLNTSSINFNSLHNRSLLWTYLGGSQESAWTHVSGFPGAGGLCWDAAIIHQGVRTQLVARSL